MAETTIGGEVAIAMAAIGRALDAQKTADAHCREGNRKLSSLHMETAAINCELASEKFLAAGRLLDGEEHNESPEGE